MSEQEQPRTGLFTSRYEARLESLPDIKGQTTELFSRLAREMHAALVKATDDKRQYRAVVEVRMAVLVDPAQAQVGDYVSHEDLRECYSHTLSDTASAVACLFPVKGVGEARHFVRVDAGYWQRIS